MDDNNRRECGSGQSMGRKSIANRNSFNTDFQAVVSQRYSNKFNWLSETGSSEACGCRESS